MATILIVDDRPANREFLVTLLGYGGHRLLEAADGAEALAMTRLERPELVIADVLMPTMDGYELVRQLRADPQLAATRVIFYTAHYHEQEAQALARSCGVSHVLTKPCEPEVVLRTVGEALGHTPPPAPAVPAGEFDRDHLRLLTDKLSAKADELQRTNDRLTALIELGLRFGSERDPGQLLQGFCHAARDIVAARHAIVAIRDPEGTRLRYVFTSGMDHATAGRVKLTGPSAFGVAGVTAIRVRGTNPGGDPAAAGFTAELPPFRSWLVAQIRSLSRTYGWVCLLDKLGSDSFTEADEQLADMLAAQVGRIYENGSLYYESVRHAQDLQREVAERKRAELAVRESEERYRLLVESIPHMVWMTRPDGLADYINRRGAEHFGVEPEDTYGWGWMDLLHPDDREEARRRWEAAVRTGTAYQTEYRLLGADREYRWYLSQGVPLRGAGGAVEKWVGTWTDITDRKRAEEELRRTATLLRAVSDGTTDAVFVKDREGRYLLFNPAAARFVGRAVEDVLGKGDDELFDPEGVRVVKARDRRVMASGRAETEEEVLTAAGVTRTYLATKAPYRDTSGEILGVIGVSHDITGRKRTEAALRAAEARLQYLVTSSPAVLFTLKVDEDRIVGISWISENVRALFDSSPSEALAPDWWVANIHAEDREAVMAQTQADLFGRDHATHEYRFRHADGKYRWTRGEIRLIRDAAGRPREAVGSWSDITERKRLEDQVRQAQKMEAVGQLAGGVAHDFNNLLTVITGYSDLLLQSVPAEDPSRELLGEIRKAGERSAGLTRQLLAFSRQSVIAPQVLSLNAVVADTEKMLRRVIGEDVRLATAPRPDLWLVRADPGQLEQVLLNLAVNARDAMPTGGCLTVETQNVELDELYAAAHPEARPGPHVLLAVSDTGTGMAPEVRGRIFEPFFTTKGVGKGTGLGLSVVHGIVKQSGGHVEVYSEVGLGTTFKVYLPRVTEAGGPAKPAPTSADPPRGAETVLLVEDEEGVRTLTRHVLQGCGYTVLEASDGEEAVRAAAAHAGPIHLVVTDVVMPRLGGRELARRLVARHPGLRVLFVSGYTDDAVVRHGVLHDRVNFLQKPFSPAMLAHKVREVLDAAPK